MNIPRVYLEGLLYALILGVGSWLLISADAFEVFYHFSRSHEDHELDEIVLVIPFLLVSIILFSIFRVRELSRKTAALKESQAELEAANKEILRATNAKDEFMSMACHELRSPLSGIDSSLQLLQLSTCEKESREYVGLALTATRNLSTLINDVLMFSRIAYDKHPFEHSDINLSGVVESVGHLVKLQADKKGLAFSSTLDDSVPDSVTGNAASLRIVMLNLLGNAIKYTDKGEVALHCTYEAPQEKLVISVSDTGVGIPPDKQDVIFEPYQQANREHSARGIGLGLSIVHRVISQQNGTITVESQPGTGATFTVELPATA